MWRQVGRQMNDPLYRNSFFIVLSSVFNAGCGFFFWMLAARLYSVEDVGVATALISSLGLVILFSRLGFDVSIIRFFPGEDRGKVFGTALVITTAAAMAVGAAYVAAVGVVSPGLAFLQRWEYAVVFLMIVVANSVVATTGNAFVAGRRADHFFCQNLLMASRIGLLVPLAVLGSMGIFGSVGLGYLVATALAFLLLKRSIPIHRLKIDREFLKRSLRFSSWSFLSNILFAAPTLMLPIMVLNLLSEAEAAKYYIAFAIGNLVQIIPTALGTSLLVEGSYGEGLKKNVMRAGMAVLLVLVPAVLVIYVFGGNILGMLKEEYMGGLELLRILVLSSFLVAVYSLFVPIQNVRMRVESIARLNLVRGVLLLGLSYVFVVRYGITGAGYAWAVTYGIVDLMIGGVAWREGWV